MATNTTNYNLVKPAYSDTADIVDLNGNMDIIDGQMKTNADNISALNTNIGSLANQIADIESPNTASNQTQMTPLESGESYSAYGGCWYRKYGNHVWVHLGLQSLTANTPQRVFTLPAGYRPKGIHIAFGLGGSTYVAISRIQVDESGYIIVTSDDTYCCADFEFIVAG